jgi:mono/diheme cytochrome c family protein
MMRRLHKIIALIAARAVLVLALEFPSPDAQAAEQTKTAPTAKLVGPKNCAECHRPMHDTWRHSAHFKSFNSMHRMRSARRIADRLGIERIKQGDQCAKCHYTRESSSSHSLPIAGVSCESCHGAAEKWNAIHSDLTNPDRLKQAEKLGLIRPSNLYDLANQCVQCHTVPDERLVNIGGHNPGGSFEVVAWLQGEVRHNFIETRGAHNQQTTPERKRLFYIVGQGLALEHAYRELAQSQASGPYKQERIDRGKAALKKLRAIQKLLSITPLQEMIQIAERLKPASENKAELLKAAEAIGALNRKIASTHTGAEFTALDKLLPKPSDYIGKVHHP